MRPINCPSVLNVVANQHFFLDLPVGAVVYDALQLILGGTFTIAQITNLSLKADGREVQYFASGTELQDINDYYGRPANAALLQLPFSRPEMIELGDQRRTGLATARLSSLTLEGDIGAATSPTLAAQRMISPHTQENAMPLCTKVKRFPFVLSASGQYEVLGLPLGGRIMAMHFYKSDISSVIIQDEQGIIYEGTKTRLEFLQQLFGGRVPQTSVMTTVDFCLDNDPSRALVTTRKGADNIERAKSFRFLPTADSSGAMPVIVEYLDTIGNA